MAESTLIGDAKKGFEDLITKLRATLDTKATSSGTTQPQQVGYFEGDDAGEYVRVYAPLLSLAPHEMHVKIGSDEFVLTAAQDLTKSGAMVGNVLRFFTYQAEGAKYKTLFALPKSAMLTPPAAAAAVSFGKLEGKDRDSLIDGQSIIQDARKAYDSARAEFMGALQDLQNFVAEQAKLGKQFPALRNLLESSGATNVVGCISKAKEANLSADLRPRVTIAPASVSAGGKEDTSSGNENPKSKDANSSQKGTSKKARKTHARNIQRLFPGKN